MKILYITPNGDLGGISKYIQELITNIPNDVTPYFATTQQGYLTDLLTDLGYKDNIFYFPITNKIYNINVLYKSVQGCFSIINKIKPDIIHVNSLPTSFPGRLCGLIKKIPVVYVPHGWAFIPTGRNLCNVIIYGIIEIFLSIITTKIICVSIYEHQLALKVMPFARKKLITIHNGISDISEEFRKKEFSQDKLKIVMISRFCPQKDPYTLINAVNELNKEGLNIELNLYGYGQELQQVLDLIQSCNCPNIQYKGEISDVTPILKDYDVYSLITNWEGLPIGIIEALRAGLPVIVSNVGGCSELIDGNGYLVPRKGNVEIKFALKDLYENNYKLYQMGKNSRKLYEQEFICEQMLDKTLNLYNQVVVK